MFNKAILKRIFVTTIGVIVMLLFLLALCFGKFVALGIAVLPSLCLGLALAGITSVLMDLFVLLRLTPKSTVVDFFIEDSKLWWKVKKAPAFWPTFVGTLGALVLASYLVSQHVTASTELFWVLAFVISPLIVITAGNDISQAFHYWPMEFIVKKALGPRQTDYEGVGELLALEESMEKTSQQLGIPFDKKYVRQILEVLNTRQYDMKREHILELFKAALETARKDDAQLKGNSGLIQATPESDSEAK